MKNWIVGWVVRLFIAAALLFSLGTPSVYADDVVIADYTTKFAWRGKENRNRAGNIALAAKILDGTVVLPGGTFSFNTVVGNRTEKRGFRMAKTIVSGDLLEGVGGGICQVSSTLHAATLLAGLTMVEEHPHSRASTYISPSLDATVSWGSLDFRFSNNFNFPIRLHTVVDKGTLNIQVLGLYDPYDVTVEFWIKKKRLFKTRYVLNENLPAGSKKKREPGTLGYDMERIRTIRTRTGVAYSREVVKYHYEPSSRVWELGPRRDNK